MLHRQAQGQSGITLLELMLVVALVSLISAIAVPSYTRVVENMRVSKARSEIMQINLGVSRRRQLNGNMPDTLEGIPDIPLTDPWGRPYVYYSFSAPDFRRGQVRKDRNLTPINTAFDLYSVGKDGNSVPPLTARHSQDDIVLARDGEFVGLGKDF
jgi:general secretion pathway protein G